MEKGDVMNLSNRLKEYRQNYGYTQEDVAAACGVSRQAVTKWEAGSSVPDIDNLFRLSELFRVSMDMLLTGNESAFRSDVHPVRESGAENEKLINKGLRQAMGCDDPHDEIQIFIEYIGRMMHCDRIFIFEKDPRGDYCNTYEWCSRGVKSQIDRLQGVPSSDLVSWMDTFRRGRYVFIENLKEMEQNNPALYNWMIPQQTRRLIVFPLFGGTGFFGVDNPVTAFVRQTAALMELIVHFVESMMQRRDLVQRLLIETDQTLDTDRTEHRARYYINVKTGNIVLNAEVFRDLGYHLEAHNTEELKRLLDRHPECRSRVLEDGLNKVRETRQARTIEFVFYTHDHLIRWMRLSIRPFLDGRGDLLQIHGTLQDISGEHEVIDRYNVFTAHLRGGMHICYLSDPCHLYYASDNLCELVGYTRRDFDEIVGDSYDSLILEEDLPSFKGFVRRLTENPGTVETCEYSLKHRNGSLVRVIDTMESILDGNGIVYGYANVMDVSELHRTLDIAENNERIRLAELDKQFEVVDALSRDYSNIFLVDLELEQAVIHKLSGYVTRGMDKKSAEPIPYYDYCRRYIEDRVYPDDREMMYKAMHPDTVRQKLRESDEYVSSYRILENGEMRYCQFKYLVPDQKGRNSRSPARVIAAFRSIDAMVRQEKERSRAMRLRENIINAFLEIYQAGYYVDLEEDTVSEFTRGHEGILPQQGAELSLQSAGILPDVSKKMNKLLSPETVQEKLFDRDYACEQCRNGEKTWYEFGLIAGSRGENGNLKQYYIMVRDISTEKEWEFRKADELRRSHRREREMQENAFRDVLTGVMNRTAYRQACEELKKCRALGVIYCDVNGLKHSNDTFGHNAGDRLLCRFADLLKHNISADSIFRIGGDEFVCLIGEIGREKFMARCEALAENIMKEDHIAAFGCAYGSGGEEEALIQEAEKLMYLKKSEQKEKAAEKQEA